jgi:hypothetical protein
MKTSQGSGELNEHSGTAPEICDCQTHAGRVQRRRQRIDAVAEVLDDAIKLMAENELLFEPASVDERISVTLAHHAKVIPIHPSVEAEYSLRPLSLRSGGGGLYHFNMRILEQETQQDWHLSDGNFDTPLRLVRRVLRTC